MEVITIYWLVWFKRKPYSILGRTHTWLSFSVSCQSTTVPVPQSPAALQPRCSGHNRAWARLPLVHMSSSHHAGEQHRDWLTSPTFLGLTSCRFGHRQHSRIPGSLDYARRRINTHDYTSRPRCAAVLGLMHERLCCAIAHLFQHAGGGREVQRASATDGALCLVWARPQWIKHKRPVWHTVYWSRWLKTMPPFFYLLNEETN